MKGKCCCITSFVSKGGTIGKIVGYNEINNRVHSIVDSECRYRVGSVIPNGNTLRQIILRFVLVCDTLEQMAHDVEEINSSVNVSDDRGEDLCLRFNVRAFLNQVE